MNLTFIPVFKPYKLYIIRHYTDIVYTHWIKNNYKEIFSNIDILDFHNCLMSCLKGSPTTQSYKLCISYSSNQIYIPESNNHNILCGEHSFLIGRDYLWKARAWIWLLRYTFVFLTSSPVSSNQNILCLLYSFQSLNIILLQ